MGEIFENCQVKFQPKIEDNFERFTYIKIMDVLENDPALHAGVLCILSIYFLIYYSLVRFALRNSEVLLLILQFFHLLARAIVTMLSVGSFIQLFVFLVKLKIWSSLEMASHMLV